jgi:ankyrin repeat protein
LHGLTSLLFAVKALPRGHLDVVKVLVENGADVNAETKDGRTALHIAQERGPKEIEAISRSRGAKE